MESRRLPPAEWVQWEKVRRQQEEEDEAECIDIVKDAIGDELEWENVQRNPLRRVQEQYESKMQNSAKELADPFQLKPFDDSIRNAQLENQSITAASSSFCILLMTTKGSKSLHTN